MTMAMAISGITSAGQERNDNARASAADAVTATRYTAMRPALCTSRGSLCTM